MKRLIFILALLMLAMPAKAQEEPKMLTFSHTVYYPGMSKREIKWKAYEWYREKEGKGEGIHFHESTENNYGNLTIFMTDCPNFGVSEFLGGGNSRIAISFEVIARDGAYTIYATQIDTYYNPMLGILYGENGQLYPELYSKKQLKLLAPIVEYVSDIADGIFREFDEYMQQQ